MTAAVPDPRFRDQLAQGHTHDWTDWVRPAVLRDSFGVVMDSAGVVIRRLTGADQPVTPAWWRTCRTCPSEESAYPAANQRAAEAATDALMWAAWTVEHSPGIKHQAKAVTAIRTRAAALASPAPAPRAEEE